MAKTTNLNIRIDPVVKEQAEKLFRNFGINISDAINIFLHQSLISGGLPFNIQLPIPNFENMYTTKQVDKKIKSESSRFFDDLNDPFAELDP